MTVYVSISQYLWVCVSMFKSVWRCVSMHELGQWVWTFILVLYECKSNLYMRKGCLHIEEHTRIYASEHIMLEYTNFRQCFKSADNIVKLLSRIPHKPDCEGFRCVSFKCGGGAYLWEWLSITSMSEPAALALAALFLGCWFVYCISKKIWIRWDIRV
jgi:hypothetical protein